MSNLGIRTDASGTFGALTLGGVDKVTVGANGIQAGSYSPDSITATELAPGALIETSPLNGIGYGPGAGGTVTQATSKATAVTLNKPCGRITMNAASLAANSSVNFTLINSQISNVDLLLVAVVGNGNYVASVVATAGGSAIIRLTNITGGAVAEAVGVNFTIIKGANS